MMMPRPPSPEPSMKSNDSMFTPPDLHSNPPDADPHSSMMPQPPYPEPSMRSNDSMFTPPDLNSNPPHADPHELGADLTQDQSVCGDGDPVITCGHSDDKQTDNILGRVAENHKASLRGRFENISEGILKPRPKKLFSEIYTGLYITKGESEGVNKEHEVWQVESASRTQATEDTSINCNDIFKPLPGQEKHIRTVMTRGVAGIGKTVSVHKFILDWTDGVANQNVFLFPLPFRELNLVRSHEYSLHSLLLHFYPELEELKNDEVYKDTQILFIFDGLDESRISLNFQTKMSVSNVKQTASVDVLITSLIQGTLLSSALVWITSRPAAASQIPAQYIKLFTEIRGFNDFQKEEYFRKRISDENQANRIISHIRASRSLQIMCHIPVFCWIAATVLQQILEQDNTKEIPKTMTEMFAHFLLIQTTRKNQKYQTEIESKDQIRSDLETQKEIILRLAKLAFKHLENGNLMFYEKDLIQCGIDVSEASVYSGMCTEIFKEESLFNQKKIYCFVHLTVQEFLAALHIFVAYSNDMENMGDFFNLEESLKVAATKVLESRNGHLDLFLRFLVGICLESNQRLLQFLLNQIHNTSKSIEKTCQYIKKLNREDLSPERCINLFNCLFEMKDHSMHEEIQVFLSSKNFNQELSPAHCSALAHNLLMCEEVLDEFDLKKYNTSDEGRRRLIPVVSCCSKAILDRCRLNKMSCETVKRCLQHANSLIFLDLSRNPLEDSGVHIVCAGLTSPHCKLQTLRLGDCKVSAESCEIVASVLLSPNSLIELDLSHNDLGDSGVQLLIKGLSSPHCKLQTLRLSASLISEEGCGFLASALTSNPSHLEELDLSYNHPGESGLKLLSARMKDPHCKLEMLNTDHCADIRLRSGVQKYACTLTLDPNTAHKRLSLSEGNRKVTHDGENSFHLDHQDRCHVMCRESLSGRCYWEVEWSGDKGAHIAVGYRRTKKTGRNEVSMLGCDEMWSLLYSDDCCSARHNDKDIKIPGLSSGCRRVGVYLDWSAGTLSFYSVSSDTLTHLHMFHSTFTKPLYAGFWLQSHSSVSLC